jgi:hypothetical protein
VTGGAVPMVVCALFLAGGSAFAAPPPQPEIVPVPGAPELGSGAFADDRLGRLALGLEVDLVPYLLNGAHADVWVGRDAWRLRAIAATDVAPSFFTPTGFEDLRTTIFEVEIDRFFGAQADRFRGPWVAGGGGLSRLTIDASDGSGRGSISAFELSAGVGWSFALPRNLYLDPWIGVGYQLTPSSVEVGAQTWHPVRFGPLLGLKVGWNLYL